MNWINALGDLGSIFTALVAIYAYADYRRSLYRRIRAVENALAKKTQPNDNSSLTISQVAAVITATEDQVIEAAARSKRVVSDGGQLGKGYCLRLRNQ